MKGEWRDQPKEKMREISRYEGHSPTATNPQDPEGLDIDTETPFHGDGHLEQEVKRVIAGANRLYKGDITHPNFIVFMLMERAARWDDAEQFGFMLKLVQTYYKTNKPDRYPEDFSILKILKIFLSDPKKYVEGFEADGGSADVGSIARNFWTKYDEWQDKFAESLQSLISKP